LTALTTEVRKLVNDLAARGEIVVVMGYLKEGPKAKGNQAANLSPL
jgi:hypothetical protein